MYYLKSRYYSPEVGRFINSDEPAYLGASRDFASINLFAYCGNNPINREDASGNCWHIAIGAVIGGIVSGASTWHQTHDLEKTIDAGVAGAVTGALCSAGGWWVLAGAAFSGVHTAVASNGNALTRFAKGFVNAMTVCYFGSVGSFATELIPETGWRYLGEFFFDLEFGVAVALADYALQSTIDRSAEENDKKSYYSCYGGSVQRTVVNFACENETLPYHR